MRFKDCRVRGEDFSKNDLLLIDMAKPSNLLSGMLDKLIAIQGAKIRGKPHA